MFWIRATHYSRPGDFLGLKLGEDKEPMKLLSQLERLLFHQEQRCFFCSALLSKENASVEHLCAVSNGGGNSEDNCVVCCKELNRVLGNKSVREKFQVVLNQQGGFKCPAGAGEYAKSKPAIARNGEANGQGAKDLYAVAISNLKSIEEKSRPKTLKALTSLMRANSRADAKELEEILARMQTEGAVILEGTKVRYLF